MVLAPAERAVGDNRPYQAGTVGKYKVGEEFFEGRLKFFSRALFDPLAGEDEGGDGGGGIEEESGGGVDKK